VGLLGVSAGYLLRQQKPPSPTVEQPAEKSQEDLPPVLTIPSEPVETAEEPPPPPVLTAPSEPVETIGEPPPPPAPKGPSVEELQGTWKLEKELNLNSTTGQFEEQTSITCKRNCHFLFKGNDVCFKDTFPPQGLPLLCTDEDYLPFTISGNMLSWQHISSIWEVEIKNGKLEVLYPGKATYSLKRIFVKVE